MKISFIKPIAFQYKSPLKTEWLKGNMPTVKKGLYGGELTKKNVTLEHILPHSQGGKTRFENLALAVDKNNFKRGAEPINKFLTIDMFNEYIEQFKNILLPDFDGNKYIEQLTNTIKRFIKE